MTAGVYGWHGDRPPLIVLLVERTVAHTPAESNGIEPEPVADPRRPAVPVHVRRLGTLLVWAILLYLGLRFFPAVKVLLLGVLAASAVASALWPLVQRVGRSRGLSAVVVGLGFVATVAAVVAVVGVLLARPIRRELTQLPEARQNLDAALKGWSQQLEISPPIDTATLVSQAGSFVGRVGNVAASVGQTLVSVGVALAFIFIGSIYLLAEPRDTLLGPLLPALPPRRRPQLVAALDELGPKLRWWLIGVLVSMAVVAAVSAVGYTVSGIKFAIPLAILAGLCELVPTVGPIAGGAAALLVATTQGSGQVAGAVATWGVVQVLESYVILPLVMRRAVRMPAVVTLFSVIVWGEVFGAAGLFMAIPLNLLVWTAFKHFVIEDRRAAEAGGNDGAGDADRVAASDGDRPASRPEPAVPRGVDPDREVLAAEAHPT